jgi:hypothetical protein
MGRAAEPLAGLSGAELLLVWDTAAGLPPPRRGPAILRAVVPELAVDPELLPIGACDTLLLGLRVGTFGGPLSAVADCPGCGETVDVETDTAEILAGLPQPDLAPTGPGRVEAGGLTVEFRLPTTRDVLAAAADSSPRRQLAVRCVLAVGGDGDPPAEHELPDAVLTAVADAMAAQDPAGDLQLRLECEACGAHWSTRFDVAAFLWAEIVAAGTGLLYEVDALAVRYGWSERDILAMSPARRRAYMELT